MATLSWLLDVNAPNAAKTFDDIKIRMDKLDASLKKTREISVGDRSAMATFAKLQLQADRFKDKLHGMDLTIDGAGRAEAQLLGLEATADRLNDKLGNIGVGVHRSLRSRLAGGFFGLSGGGGSKEKGILAALFGGGAAAGPSGLGTGVAGLGQAGPAALGIGAVLAAALAPAALPLGLGGLFGGGAALGAYDLGKKANKQMQALAKSLASAQSAQAAAASGRTRRAAAQRVGDIRSQMKSLRQTSGPELAIFGAFQDLGSVAKDVFAGALKTPGAGFSGGGPGGTQGAPSFMTGLAGILKQIGGFVKSIGPQLGDLFRASLPFLNMFVKLLERSAKILLPVFAQSLQQMTPFLPQISKGLLAVVQGLAGMIKAMGPGGMKAATEIFVALCKVIEGALIGVGYTATFLAENIVKAAHNMRKTWDVFRHDTAVTFDAVRHAIAAALDWVSAHFDQWRHGWAHIWDTVYSNTIGVVIRIDRGIVNWLGKLHGQIDGVFHGALNWLYTAGKNVVQGLWNGLLFIWHKVTSFISGIASWIKSHKGPVHLDAKLLEPAGRALMGGLLRGLTGGFGAVASFVGGIAGRISGAIGRGLSGAPEGIAAAMLPAFGWSPAQMAPLVALWNRESGWRWNALNPTSGAYGIPQALPASKMAAAGADWRTNPATQIRWGLSYIKSRYGSPAAAWAHELAAGWYGSGLTGGIFNRPTLIGVGERGPERVDVTPLGRRGGQGGALVHVDQMVVQDATDAALVASRLSFSIVAAGLS